jgi:hypothetical protein
LAKDIFGLFFKTTRLFLATDLILLYRLPIFLPIGILTALEGKIFYLMNQILSPYIRLKVLPLRDLGEI